MIGHEGELTVANGASLKTCCTVCSSLAAATSP